MRVEFRKLRQVTSWYDILEELQAAIDYLLFFSAFGISNDQFAILNVAKPHLQHLTDSHPIAGH